MRKKSDFLAQLDQFDRIVVAYEESAKEGEAAALIQSLTGLEAGCKLLFIFWTRGRLTLHEAAHEKRRIHSHGNTSR